MNNSNFFSKIHRRQTSSNYCRWTGNFLLLSFFQSLPLLFDIFRRTGIYSSKRWKHHKNFHYVASLNSITVSWCARAFIFATKINKWSLLEFSRFSVYFFLEKKPIKAHDFQRKFSKASKQNRKNEDVTSTYTTSEQIDVKTYFEKWMFAAVCVKSIAVQLKNVKLKPHEVKLMSSGMILRSFLVGVRERESDCGWFPFGSQMLRNSSRINWKRTKSRESIMLGRRIGRKTDKNPHMNSWNCVNSQNKNAFKIVTAVPGVEFRMQ